MLDIRPISLHSHDQSRPGGCGSDEFVEDGMNIVNLALAGCMDSKTVRAFLNHYGYTNVKVGVSLEREGDPENGVQAVEMNRGLFTHALEQAEGHSPESIDGIQLRSPSPLSAAPSTPSNGTLGLQDAISEDSTGLGDAVSENSGSQGALPENNPGLLGAFHETPSLRGVLPEDNLDPHDGLFGIQDQPLEEFRRVSEQAPSNTPYLQNMLKYQQIMGGAQTDDTGYQAAIDKSRTQQFMDQAPGATPEEAKSCLEDAKGDLDEAMFLFALRQSLDGPDEEEAS